MATKKQFTIKSDDAVKAYLTIMNFTIGLTPKEIDIVADIIKSGSVLSKPVKKQLQTKYALKARHIAQYVYLLLNKKVFVRMGDEIKINPKIDINNTDIELLIKIDGK